MSEQSFFVQHNKAAILIEGVAGSGKSTLLAKQMALLRDEPGKRLMLAYSRAGAQVLREYTARLGLHFETDDASNKISTIDALALEALGALGDERSLLSSQQVVEQILPTVVEAACEDLLGTDFYAPHLGSQDMWLLLDDIDYFRASLAYQQDSLEEQVAICGDRLNFDVRLVARCFERYEDARWTWYNRDEASFTGYREREGFRRIAEAVSDLYHHEGFEHCTVLQGYRFVFIDEFHDVSPMQLDFIQRLIGPSCFVMAVGDRCQNVFAWRGTDTDVVFEHFIQYFNAAVVYQNYSHRFDQGIADLASKISTTPIEAAVLPEVVIEQRAKQQFPELLTKKPLKDVALIAQNQLQLMKAAWQLWMHTQGGYRFSYNLSQLYVVALVNALYALKTGQLPLVMGSELEELSSHTQSAGRRRISEQAAKRAFAYDLKRFYQGPYCLLSAEAKAEIIQTANPQSFQQYVFMHLAPGQATPAFSEGMARALRGVLKRDMKAPLAPVLAEFAEEAGLFRTIEAAGLAFEYHVSSWRILLKLLHSLRLTIEDWPRFSYSLYRSWSARSGLTCLTVGQAKGREFERVVLYSADEQGFLPRQLGQDSARHEFYVGLTRVRRHLQFWESYF